MSSQDLQTLQTTRGKRLSQLGIYGLLTSLALSAGATSFADILAAEKKAVENGVRTQQRIETLDDERTDLLGQYRTAVKQEEDLIKYNDQLRAVRQSQEEEVASYREQLQRVGNLEEQIYPLMSDMLDTLEEFVTIDAPFLHEERTNRVRNLRKLYAASPSTISHSEKYRRILEAYQIENDYGRTVEAYDGPVTRDAREQIVTFLKVGRVIFVYQTLDGSRSFLWQRDARQWIPLEDRFNHAIGRGIKMAREQIPSDLLLLPVSKSQS